MALQRPDDLPSALVELCMFLSHGIWLLRTRKIRKRAREAMVCYEDFPEAIEWQEKGFQLNLRSFRSCCRTEDVVGDDDVNDNGEGRG